MSRQLNRQEPQFLTDRMLGTLTRYLRFMGYDTLSANDLLEGNRKEDTVLLEMTRTGNRILLTRDRELARRGRDRAIWIASEMIYDQVRQLAALGLITPQLRMNRCSLCNHLLRRARREEIGGADYAPRNERDLSFYWCSRCRKLYWMGSHGTDLTQRFEKYRVKKGEKN